jgi:hypothetical protein
MEHRDNIHVVELVVLGLHTGLRAASVRTVKLKRHEVPINKMAV